MQNENQSGAEARLQAFVDAESKSRAELSTGPTVGTDEVVDLIFATEGAPTSKRGTLLTVRRREPVLGVQKAA